MINPCKHDTNGDGNCQHHPNGCPGTSDIPLKPGYYWAKWRIPSDGTHEAELQTFPNDYWEIVQVNENGDISHPEEDEALSVSVCGVRETQWRDCFVWGQFISPLR